MSRLFTLILLALSATMIGCASAPDIEETQSGFLQDYSKMQPVEGEEGVLRYVADGFSPQNYARVEIEPAEVKISQALQKDSSLSVEDQTQLAKYFADQMQAVIGNEVTLGNTGGTLKMRPAFTGITNASEDMSAWQYIPIAAVVTGVKEATGNRDKVPVMFLEFEGKDADSGEVVVQTMRSLRMENLDPKQLEELGVDAVKPRIDEAILELQQMLNKHVR